MHNDRGSLLIVTLWIMLILSAIAVAVSVRSAVDAKMTRFFYDRAHERYLARAGIDLGMYILESDKEPRIDSRNDTWYNHESISEIIENEELSSLMISIVDETRKININTAPESVISALFDSIHRNKPFVGNKDTMCDDLFDVLRKGSLGDNETAKKGSSDCVFQFLEQLSVLKSFTPADRNTLKDYVTVYPQIKDVHKVNINTASADVLQALLSGTVANDDDKQTVLHAVRAYLESIEDENSSRYFTQQHLSAYKFLDVLGLQRDVKLVSLVVQFLKNCTVDSRYFTIVSQAPRSGYTVEVIVGPPAGLASLGYQVNADDELVVHRWQEYTYKETI